MPPNKTGKTTKKIIFKKRNHIFLNFSFDSAKNLFIAGKKLADKIPQGRTLIETILLTALYQPFSFIIWKYPNKTESKLFEKETNNPKTKSGQAKVKYLFQRLISNFKERGKIL